MEKTLIVSSKDMELLKAFLEKHELRIAGDPQRCDNDRYRVVISGEEASMVAFFHKFRQKKTGPSFGGVMGEIEQLSVKMAGELGKMSRRAHNDVARFFDRMLG